MNKQGKNENRHTKAEMVAWIELRPPVTRGKLVGAFEDMEYEQLLRWLSEASTQTHAV
jgi:hypothetical protein